MAQKFCFWAFFFCDMTKLLLRLFVKDYQNTTSPTVHLEIGKLAGVVGILCNVILSSLKIVTGTIIGAISIVADGVNNLSDASSSIVTLVGFHMAQKPADEEHPYGHARYEYISGLVVAFFVLLVGLSLIKSSIGKIVTPESTSISPLAIGILILSVLVKLWLSSFFGKLGKQIDSSTLKASSVDSRNDVIATIAVLLGCLVEYFLDINVDGYVGVAVALFILFSGISIAKETLSPLLGRKADPELVDKITMDILSYPKVLGLHDLLIHDYGPGQCFASVHVEISADENPLICHGIIDKMEREIYRNYNVHLVIHYDPVVVDDKELNEIKCTVDRIINSIDSELSLHDFRVVRGTKRNKLYFDLVVPYSLKKSFKTIESEIDEKLLQSGLDYKTIINFDRE